MHRRARKTTHSNQRGAAIMIMLLILILGAASFLLKKLGKGDARQPGNLATTADIGAITGALIGYAAINGFCLPCPDIDNDGSADAAACATGTGTLPWVTLGLGALDSWGHRLRYVVDPDFAGTGACAITQLTQSDITVRSRDAAGVPFDLFPVAADNPPAVVIAHGANGYGAFDASGAAMPPPPASHSDEEINRSQADDLMQRVASDTASVAVGGPFDDLVGWVDMTRFRAQLTKVGLPAS